MLRIDKIAASLDIPADFLIPYGHYKAKVDLRLFDAIAQRTPGRYILVTAITPTPLGEGKTTVTLGLSMAINRLKKKAVATIREPSLAPVFGTKGGGAGGGRSEALPVEDLNLHFTGDSHEIASAHNLVSALIDSHIYHSNTLGFDGENIFWPRCMDINDRALRYVQVYPYGKQDTVPRAERFVVTAASEVMAVVSLSNDMAELERNLSRIVVAQSKSGTFITVGDLKATGSMMALLKEAIKPNLIQTTEGTACIVHTGPFANISHGNNSIIADKLALAVADYVVSESGFGADCGAEKCVNIKCRRVDIRPSAVVLVATVRGVKFHSGRFPCRLRRYMDESIYQEDIESIECGSANLKKQIENIHYYGLPVVVAINRFKTDTENELEFLKKKALEYGAEDVAVVNCYYEGSEGAVDLAAKAMSLADNFSGAVRFSYNLEDPLEDKIRALVQNVYGGTDIVLSSKVREKLDLFTRTGFQNLPICIVKTHLSLSGDSSKKGAPKDFMLPIDDAFLFAGAGYISVISGSVLLMPGLPENPRAVDIYVNAQGEVKGVY